MDAARAESMIVTAEDARAAMRRGDNAEGMDAFEASYADMQEALDWFLQAGRADDAFRLSAALTAFWMSSKRADDGKTWLEGALATGEGSDAGRARGLHDLGYLAFFTGGYDVAERRFEESRELAERAGDRNIVALALAGSARVHLSDNPAVSVALLREALAITQDMPDSFGRGSAGHVLGVALQLSGDLEGARDVMAERLRHARETGNSFVVFVEASNLSIVERKLGNLDAAEALSREALAIVVRKNDQMAIPWVINGLAAETAAKGRTERAAQLLTIAESLLARAGGEWPADEREQYEGTLATVSGALEPAELERLRAEAEAMSLKQATAVALDSGDD
jgi:tetratricopeptide (TPR) repeat protein